LWKSGGVKTSGTTTPKVMKFVGIENKTKQAMDGCPILEEAIYCTCTLILI